MRIGGAQECIVANLGCSRWALQQSLQAASRETVRVTGIGFETLQNMPRGLFRAGQTV
jgi:hypothetical protein